MTTEQEMTEWAISPLPWRRLSAREQVHGVSSGVGRQLSWGLGRRALGCLSLYWGYRERTGTYNGQNGCRIMQWISIYDVCRVSQEEQDVSDTEDTPCVSGLSVVEILIKTVSRSWCVCTYVRPPEDRGVLSGIKATPHIRGTNVSVVALSNLWFRWLRHPSVR